MGLFILGLFVGAILGALCMGLLVASSMENYRKMRERQIH